MTADDFEALQTSAGLGEKPGRNHFIQSAGTKSQSASRSGIGARRPGAVSSIKALMKIIGNQNNIGMTRSPRPNRARHLASRADNVLLTTAVPGRPYTNTSGAVAIC
jgi:hypothetical protein